jgi:hypothetical protein
MQTIRRTKVTLEELPELMRHVTQDPIPPEVLERRRKILAEAESVRSEMEPIEDDIKDLIRKERREALLG